MKVAIFSTCVVDLMFPEVGKAMVEVLERFGCDCYLPGDQICCGQPTYNSGYSKATQKVFHNEIDALLSIDADYIVGPAGSCVAMLREYPELLKDDPEYADKAREVAAKSYEFSQFLWRILGVENAGAELNAKATYHRSCHMTRLLGESEAPYALLDHVKGLEMIPLENAHDCCGFGGTFSAKEPEMSQLMVTEKVRHIVDTGAEVLVSCDMGCLMNIGGRFNREGKKIKIMHLAEVLNSNVDESRITYLKHAPVK
ncbi:(Fe-S)-binding protein [Agrilactobacillus fermenti]|uniref:(Fe-S)-binding protein n=1 Tax=Agrilactobacillus fermenti TaxID=2586909 RepID=UPI001E57AC8C|nr:(Fe-S)-binding protein [Agrilactobacillus fermenti]MCD2255533.1 (Fe-S)-binding protein [Agrilactobacillus fermenti]